MKFQICASEGAPGGLQSALDDDGFAVACLTEIVVGVFGIEDALERPAEYNVNELDFLRQTSDRFAVTVTLDGVTSGVRPLKMLHDAMDAIVALVGKTVAKAL